jgi:hypothetical protein
LEAVDLTWVFRQGTTRQAVIPTKVGIQVGRGQLA